MAKSEGGYDDGYRMVPCFWGTKPGSLIIMYLNRGKQAPGTRILDIGCGEGKNAAAFARAGCVVDAIDCSAIAIANGRKAFNDPINWRVADVTRLRFFPEQYRVIISYGLFHCLSSCAEIISVIAELKVATVAGGHHLVCTFNDRFQDLTAHPGFSPTLAPHNWYLDQYSDWQVEYSSDTDLHEAHPHNGIDHCHSVTRFIAKRPV